MKTTLKTILSTQQHWAKFASIPFSAKFAYKLSVFITDNLASSWKIIEEHRNKLIKKHAEDETSIDPKSQPEAYSNFIDEFTEFLETEVSIPAVGIKFSDIIDSMDDTIKIDPIVLMEIEQFFKEEPKNE